MTRVSERETLSTRQQKIATLAGKAPAMVLNTLAHPIDLTWLEEAFRRTRQDGAVGVDGVTAARYAEQLTENLSDLLERFKSGRYRAPPVRRVHIPKDGGKTRPIGIPTLEDKILQRAVLMALEPVYEQDFLDGSYGFRPGRSPHQALDALWQGLMAMGGGWVIDLDIQAFFDTLDKQHLATFLDHRVRDGVIRRAIGKWLQAGVMEAGIVTYPERGSPQGGVMTPRTQKVTSSLTGRWRLIGSKPGLTCDANGNIYMTYGAIDRFADGRTSQRCPWVARARAQRPGGVCVYVASIRPLAPSSVPLPAGSAVAARAGGAAGARGPGDLQAAAASGESPSPAGRRRWHDPQRDGGAGLGRLSGRGGPWRLGMARSRSSSSNTLSTACSDPSWSRSMRSWCPNSAASSAPPPR